MKIRLVCKEKLDSWILGKFALKMQEFLNEMGHEVDINVVPDSRADVNHYIIYLDYAHVVTSGLNTLMITHIDDSEKLNILKKGLKNADLGICMSSETTNNLIQSGLPQDKLCFVNPAHDEIMDYQKTTIGITCRVQVDGRKREYLIKKVSEQIDPRLFSFKIMGDGWEPIVNVLRSKGFEVEYYESFNLEIYTELIPSLDYYLYTGMDEGQIGCVDALSAGVKTIVTHQGYHLDSLEGIVYSYTTQEELIEIFRKIQNNIMTIIESVRYWTWDHYVNKHLEIWNYLLDVKHNENVKRVDSVYSDGLNSLLRYEVTKRSLFYRIKYELNLRFGSIRHRYYFYKKRLNK